MLRVSEPQLPEIDEEFVKGFQWRPAPWRRCEPIVARTCSTRLTQLAASQRTCNGWMIANQSPDIPGDGWNQEAERMKQQVIRDYAAARAAIEHGSAPASV